MDIFLIPESQALIIISSTWLYGHCLYEQCRAKRAQAKFKYFSHELYMYNYAQLYSTNFDCFVVDS